MCWRNKMQQLIGQSMNKSRNSQNIALNNWLIGRSIYLKLNVFFSTQPKIFFMSIRNVFYASWLYDMAEKKHIREKKKKWTPEKKNARMSPHNETFFRCQWLHSSKCNVLLVHNHVIAKNNLTTKKAIYFHSSVVFDLHQHFFDRSTKVHDYFCYSVSSIAIVVSASRRQNNRIK